jgi:phosphoribosylglycinamide formyltransferase 1
MMPNMLPIAVFLSGGGRTLKNLLDHQQNHGLPIEIRLVISSSASVAGVQIARDAGIETLVVRKADYPADVDYSEAMFAPCRKAGVSLVVMAGFLKHVQIPTDFDRRVINIHPSLIPAFSGEGMYGINVHRAAIERGVQYSGCTVHYVDNQYDHGPIILQRVCAVPPGCSPEQLAARVFELECEALPEAIASIASADCRRSERRLSR